MLPPVPLRPIVRGWSVIGRGDKFLSPGALAAVPEYGADTLRFRVQSVERPLYLAAIRQLCEELVP